MKDWLKELLEASAQCKEATATVKDVCQAFAPFLATVAKARGKTVVEILRPLFFELLCDASEEVYDERTDTFGLVFEAKEPYVAALQDEYDAKVHKFPVDAMNDDSLGEVFTFLGPKDRASVERCSLRFFKVSRRRTVFADTLNADFRQQRDDDFLYEDENGNPVPDIYWQRGMARAITRSVEMDLCTANLHILARHAPVLVRMHLKKWIPEVSSLWFPSLETATFEDISSLMRVLPIAPNLAQVTVRGSNWSEQMTRVPIPDFSQLDTFKLTPHCTYNDLAYDNTVLVQIASLNLANFTIEGRCRKSPHELLRLAQVQRIQQLAIGGSLDELNLCLAQTMPRSLCFQMCRDSMPEYKKHIGRAITRLTDSVNTAKTNGLRVLTLDISTWADSSSRETRIAVMCCFVEKFCAEFGTWNRSEFATTLQISKSQENCFPPRIITPWRTQSLIRCVDTSQD